MKLSHLLKESFEPQDLYDFYSLSFMWQSGAGNMAEDKWTKFESEYFLPLLGKLKSEYIQKLTAMFEFHEHVKIDFKKEMEKLNDYDRGVEDYKSLLAYWEKHGGTKPKEPEKIYAKNPRKAKNALWMKILERTLRLYAAKEPNEIIHQIDLVNNLAHNHGVVYEWFQDAGNIKSRPPRKNKTDKTGRYHYQWMADVLFDKAMRESFQLMVPRMSEMGRKYLFEWASANGIVDEFFKAPRKYLPKDEKEKIDLESQKYMANRETGLGSEKYRKYWIGKRGPDAEALERILMIEDDSKIKDVLAILKRLGPYLTQERTDDNAFLFDMIDNKEKQIGVHTADIPTHRKFPLIRRIKSLFWKMGLKKTSEVINKEYSKWMGPEQKPFMPKQMELELAEGFKILGTELNEALSLAILHNWQDSSSLIIVRELIEAGADVNLYLKPVHLTALGYAISWDMIELTDLLLRLGANPHLLDGMASEVEKLTNSQQIIELVKGYM